MDLLSLGKIRVFVIHRETGRLMAGVRVVLSLADRSASTEVPPARTRWATLVSDHAGYVSFNLARIAAAGFRQVPDLILEVDGDPSSSLSIADALALPQETSAHYETHAPGGTVAALPNCMSFTLRTLCTRGVRDAQGRMPCGPASCGTSVQEPDACDYELSPSSFVVRAALRSGDEDCEHIAPATLPVSRLRFWQVAVRSSGRGRLSATARSNVSAAEGDVPPVDISAATPTGGGILWGELLEFEQTWSALGHSLGEIKYSVALGPGEATQLAVIDWAREDDIMRRDHTTSAERLAHRQSRDRQIEEITTAALSENQGGGSFLAGLGVAASGSFDVLNLGATLGLGGGVSHSWGQRDLGADATQELHDKTVQASALHRAQTSTVVVQATQSEANQLSVRAVANHNHCHALTLQYYEVLRHLRLETGLVRRGWALLVPFKPLEFTRAVALRFRDTIAPALRRSDLLHGFDAVERLEIGEDAYAGSDGQSRERPSRESASTVSATSASHLITAFSIDLYSDATVNSGNTWGSVVVEVYPRGSGVPVEIWQKKKKGDGGGELKDVQWPQRTATGFGLDATAVERVRVGWFEDNGADHWGFAGMRLRCTIAGVEQEHQLINERRSSGTINHFDDSWGQWKYSDSFPLTPYVPAVAEGDGDRGVSDTGEGPAPASDAAAAKLLLAHLNANAHYYSRVVWFGMDAGERRLHLNVALASFPALLEGLDDQPVAWSGQHVAFRFMGNPPQWLRDLPRSEASPSVSILTMPTRGLFAEAQLGHCNACEKRDVTRMWNWAEMPVEALPQLQGLEPGPKGQTPDIHPSPLPAGVLNIMQPPVAPDPVGLAAAIKAVTEGASFRDMSGLAEVSDFLGQLAGGAVDLAKGEQDLRRKAAAAKQKVDTAKANRGGTQGRPSPTERVDNLNAAREVVRYADELGWSPAATADLTRSMVAGDSAATESVVETVRSKLGYPPDLFLASGTPSSATYGALETTLFDNGALLLSDFKDPGDYVLYTWEPKSSAEIEFRGIGDPDGLSGKLVVEWENCVIKESLLESISSLEDPADPNSHWAVLRITKRMAYTICQRNISVYWAVAPSVGTAIKRGAVKVSLYHGDSSEVIFAEPLDGFEPRIFEARPTIMIYLDLEMAPGTGQPAVISGGSHLFLSVRKGSPAFPRLLVVAPRSGDPAAVDFLPNGMRP